MKVDFLPYAYFEGDFVPFEDAKISIATHAVQYGTGAFGGIRGYLDESGESINIFRLLDHTKRLMDSARLLRAELNVDRESLARIIEDLTLKNNPQSDIYTRPFIYKAAQELSPRLKDMDSDIAVYQLPLGDYFDMSRPLKFLISSWVRNTDNTIPSRGKITGAYVNSAFARDQAEEAGCDDALMLDKDGKVSEASGANFFIVRNGVLITTPVTGDILEGITRRTILMLARDELGLEVQERSIDRSELYVAEEAFVCGTGAQVAVVGQIDGRAIGDGQRGEVTHKLQDLFFGIVRGKNAKYDEFLTRVPLHS